MKKLIVIVIIASGAYYGLNRDSGGVSDKQCSQAGGELTSLGCVMPMTAEKCETLGGTLRPNGDCQTKMTESKCSLMGGDLTVNNECHITR